jgi:phage terminase large subunit
VAVLEVNAQFPPKLQGLFEPHPFKVLWGGRYGMKSWGMARAMLLRMISQPTRCLGAREQMKSIKESVHKLLSDQIALLGLQELFDIQQNTIKVIKGPGVGSEVNYIGLRFNDKQVKSYEGVDICWVEEADAVSERSWDVLIPTIRKEGSEIWVSFNPRFETDPTYKLFIKNPPPGTWIQKTSWEDARDAGWLDPKIESQIIHMRDSDLDKYNHVYGGNCVSVLEGAVYAEELRAALPRIMNVPYDSFTSVSLIFDLGWADATACCFVQRVGFETRYIDYQEWTRTTWEKILQDCQRRGYTIDTIWLPHDAKAKQLGTGKSIEEITRSKGFKVRLVPKMSLADGINAARTNFETSYFDEKKCEELIKALRHYRYEFIEDPIKNIFTKVPVHDWTSHGADSYRYSSIAIRQPNGVVARVSAALLEAQDAERQLMSRLGRYRMGGMGGTTTGWMK